MISFKSVENFFEECTTGIEFKYEEKWYLIEFEGPVRKGSEQRSASEGEGFPLLYLSFSP